MTQAFVIFHWFIMKINELSFIEILNQHRCLITSIIDSTALLHNNPNAYAYCRISHTHVLLLAGVETNITQSCREIIAFITSCIYMIQQHEQAVDSRANARPINQIWASCNEKAAKDADT